MVQPTIVRSPDRWKVRDVSIMEYR